MTLSIEGTGHAVTVRNEHGVDVTTDLCASEIRAVFGPRWTAPRIEVDVLVETRMEADVVRAFTRVPGIGIHKEVRRIEFTDGTVAEYPTAWYALLPEEGEESGGQAASETAAGGLEGSRDG